jgi:alpha-N-acetylglucosamine transferase
LLNFQSARNAMKMVPLHRLVFLIPAVYLLSQMESVWRSYRDLFAEPNRQKNLMLTVPIRTVRTGHVSSLYSPYKTHGRFVQDTWQLQGVTRGMQFWTFWHTVGPIRR